AVRLLRPRHGRRGRPLGRVLRFHRRLAAADLHHELHRGHRGGGQAVQLLDQGRRRPAVRHPPRRRWPADAAVPQRRAHPEPAQRPRQPVRHDRHQLHRGQPLSRGDGRRGVQPQERLRRLRRRRHALRGHPPDRRRQPQCGVAADDRRRVRPAGGRARAGRGRRVRRGPAGPVGHQPRPGRRFGLGRAGGRARAPGAAPVRAPARRGHRRLRGAVRPLPFPPRRDPAAVRLSASPLYELPNGNHKMSKPFIGATEYFPGIGAIPYEGPESDNPLAFKVYDANKVIGGKTMRDHLRFAVCYWHTFCNAGADPFGPGTRRFPWEKGDAMATAEAKVDAAFEFFTKLGVPYWCFHDVDLAPDADDIATYEKNLKHLVGLAKARQDATGVKLLWGTANLFSHPRYMNGASTNPDFAVVARAAVQVKNVLDAVVELGGEHYVFWGGREGYATLHNTNMKRELEHFARFLAAARDYGRSIGFKGKFFIEPK